MENEHNAEIARLVHLEWLDEIEVYYRHLSTSFAIKEDVQRLIDTVRRLAALAPATIPTPMADRHTATSDPNNSPHQHADLERTLNDAAIMRERLQDRIDMAAQCVVLTLAEARALLVALDRLQQYDGNEDAR